MISLNIGVCWGILDIFNITYCQRGWTLAPVPPLGSAFEMRIYTVLCVIACDEHQKRIYFIGTAPRLWFLCDLALRHIQTTWIKIQRILLL